MELIYQTKQENHIGGEVVTEYGEHLVPLEHASEPLLTGFYLDPTKALVFVPELFDGITDVLKCKILMSKGFIEAPFEGVPEKAVEVVVEEELETSKKQSK